MVALAVLMIAGCKSQVKDRQILAKINNYEITKDEFEEEFSDSGFAASDTEESRRKFLENLIDRKLILQEAQAKGLDKEKAFLKSIERFWEQSLLKIAVDRKARDISISAYSRDKEKESALMDNWITELRKKAAIDIDYNLLKKQ